MNKQMNMHALENWQAFKPKCVMQLTSCISVSMIRNRTWAYKAMTQLYT